MSGSGEHRNAVVATLQSLDKKLDLLIGIVQSFNKRLSSLETRMSEHDGREVDIGNGAAGESGE